MTFLRKSSSDISANNLEATYDKLKPMNDYHMKTLSHYMIKNELKMSLLDEVWEQDLSHDMMTLTCLFIHNIHDKIISV